MMRTKAGICVIVAALITGVLVLGVPKYLQLRQAAQRERCLNNLLQTSCALKKCIPMEQRLPKGAPVDPKMLATMYCKGGKLPKCPSGAEYTIQYVVGGDITCPVHGGIPDEARNSLDAILSPTTNSAPTQAVQRTSHPR